uniref:Uncharacterized protein n=1 Tax=Physcomitrium patens TaxID=3218 RepID=A0A2K1IAU1_PHYPA|nr:hypothetical protein PHYPA_030971 [Physcomitrium patens]
MSSRLGCCGHPPARVIGLVNASEYKVYMAHSSGDDFEDAESISPAVPEYEGLLRRLWITKAVHRDASGRKMVTVEGITVCLRAWMHISGVSEATFYRYQAYVKANREARDHGNTGLPKPRKHTEHATATLKCILEKEADHMPHHTRSTKSGEKMVSMILLATFQWKDQIPKINEVNTAFGLREVSSSNLSKIRASRFPEFDVKRPGDNFA